MSTKATLVVQDLTYTEKFLKGVTITYSNGATAGSEVVTVSGLAITVQIGASTATQVKAAIDGNEFSSALVSVAISGTAGTVQKTCKGAFLTGGAAVAKASLTVAPLKFTAQANGGNAITMLYVGDQAFTVGTVVDATHLTVTSSTGLFVGDTVVQGANSTTITTVTDATHIIVGSTTGWIAAAASTKVAAGSEVVSVTSNAITVRIKDGASTLTQVKAALDASGPAVALVATTSSGPGGATPVYLQSCSTATNLTGGVAAAVAATVVNQDLTVTAVTAGVGGNAISLSYTTGATAGAEVVTVVGNAINVQIANGVSTATQINTAFGAFGAATALGTMTISGTGATAQKTVNALATTGAVGDGAPDYYQDGAKTALTASYVAFPFGFISNNMTLACDETAGVKGVIFSFDGINQHGSLLFGQSITWQAPNQSCIWLKFVSAAPAYRLMVQGR